MIKILEHGERFTSSCPKCNTLYSFEREDIEWDLEKAYKLSECETGIEVFGNLSIFWALIKKDKTIEPEMFVNPTDNDIEEIARKHGVEYEIKYKKVNPYTICPCCRTKVLCESKKES